MNLNQNEEQQLLSLLGDLVDARLTAERQHELVELVRENQAARDYYLMFISLHTELVWRHEAFAFSGLDELSAAETVDPRGMSTANQARRPFLQSVAGAIHPRRHPFSFLATAAMLTLCMWSAWAAWISQVDRPPIAHGPATSNPSTDFCARLLYGDFAEWGAESQQVFDGAFLREGQLLDLRQGRAVIRFERGAEVTLAGPTELTLRNDNQCRLDQGKITAHVPSSAVGFVVETPAATITDLGTQFGLKVAGDQSTEVHVFRGSVEVAQLQGHEIKARTIVRAGDAVKIGGESEDVSPVKTDDAFADMALPANTATTGRSIGINFTDNDAPRFTGQVAATTSPGLVAGTNWNNVAPRGTRQIDRDLVADVLSPKPGVIVDSRGEVVAKLTARYSFTNSGTQKSKSSFWQSGLNGNDLTTDVHIKVAGVPFERYDIYVFVSDRTAPREVKTFTKVVRIGEHNYHFRDTAPGGIRTITSVDRQKPSVGANVAIFRGLHQPSFQVDLLGAVNGKSAVYCHGVQIIEIAEPAQEKPRNPNAVSPNDS